jgi:hypothetical protein
MDIHGYRVLSIYTKKFFGLQYVDIEHHDKHGFALKMKLLHKSFKLCTMPKQKHIEFVPFNNDMHQVHHVHYTSCT